MSLQLGRFWPFSLIILSLIALFLAVNPTAVTAQERPPVLAFYYAWFDDNTWTSGQTLDTPLTPYRSTDPAAIERHVLQAQSAGINALVQSWYGPQVENNQTEPNFAALLDVAARHNFRAAVDVEVYSPFFGSAGDVQAAMSHLLATHVNHPAYFRYRGKPVIFFWKQERFSVAQWAQIRAVVDPNRTAYWVAEGVDVGYLEVFDGHHLYNVAWASDIGRELSKWPPRIQQMEASTGLDKLWVATAMPGFDETHLNRAHQNYRARNNGQFLRESFQAAVASQPDMIVITSFNEWIEGSHIEPSVAYGDFYLNLTRDLIAGLGATQPSAPPAPVEPTEAPPPLPTAEPTPEPEPTPAPLPSPTAPPAPQADVTDSLTVNRPIIAETANQHTVTSGDTLLGIALRYGVSVEELTALNALSNPNALSIGQVLRLPPASEPESVRSAGSRGYVAR